MSRKKAQKSNIGIFEGKKAEYNKQILETLFTNGVLSSWEIAKRICNHKYPGLSKYGLEAKSRRIYSIIQRKTGRLQDLKGKEYIDTENDKWVISNKGAIATLILDPQLVNRIYPDFLEIPKPFEPIKTKELKVGPIRVESGFLNELAGKARAASRNPQTLLILAEKTKKLLDDGIIDLDRIPEDKLLTLVSKMVADDGFYTKLFQKDY